jgi:molecular chaperone DnaK
VTEPIFGIDLGTTNSCLAVLEPGGPRVVDIDDQSTVPSVVSLDQGSGELVVGRRALNRRLLAPESTVRSIKRWMGRQDPVNLGGRALLPEEIAAEILRYLKVQGEKALGRPVRRAVITVPAYFGDAQRRATLRAGELAGLDVPRLLNEPTAAALIYDRLVLRDAGLAGVGGAAGAAATGRRPALDGEVQRVLVYDLGGGTFDVSVVEIGGEISEVRASTGDNQLGGDDFDQLLADYLLRHLRERGLDLSADRRALARLSDAAERAKIDLSTRPFTRVIEEALGGELHLDLEIGRAEFEELIEDHLARTMAEVERALAEAKLGAHQIDRVILMGGSTHIPRIMELIEERFDCPVERTVDPALGVALGAAVQGAILGGQVFDQILVDVAAHSLGVKTSDNVAGDLYPGAEADHFSTIIRRNTQIPASRSEVYYTVHDNQRRVRVEVYQGERPRCSENTLIGDFAFELLPAPAGSQVIIEFKYDLDGIIRVVVSQKGTDRRKEVTLRTRRQEADQEAEGPRAVDNYILRKAQALAAALPHGESERRLRDAAAAYAAALESEETPPMEMERVEDRLLMLIDELDEGGPGGQGDVPGETGGNASENGPRGASGGSGEPEELHEPR